MAIVNRHIRRSWDTWIDAPLRDTKTTKALCGRRTTEEFVGIPGVTIQPVQIGAEAGWCFLCIQAFAVEHRSRQSIINKVQGAPGIGDIYNNAGRVIDTMAQVYVSILKNATAP